MKLIKLFLTTAALLALGEQATHAQTIAPGQRIQAQPRNYPLTIKSNDSKMSVAPAPGEVESLKSFTVTVNGATEVTRDDVTYSNAPYVIAEGSGDKKYCFSMDFSGNTMTLSISSEITDPGKYEFHIPAGFYKVDGEAATEEYTFNYTIAEKIPVNFTYSVSPAPGEVESLKSFTVTIDGAKEVTKGDVTYTNAPYVLAEGSDDKIYCFGMEFAANTMTLFISNEITEPGNYVFHVPAGFYKIDSESAEKEQTFNYEIVKADETGIITKQPAGTRVDCQTEFLSWYVASGMLGGMPMNGKPTHYVIGDDDCLYLYNPILIQPYGPNQTNSYIKGVKNGDEYVFNFPQPIATRILNGKEEILYVNFMYNETQEDGSSTYVVVNENNNYSFKILENGDCVPVAEGDELYIVGYTNAEGKWEGFGNVNMNYRKFTATPHQIPENSTVQDWIMEYSKGGSSQKLQSNVEVVIVDKEIWIKGFSQTYCPNAWAYGTIDANNQITFDPYLGIAESVGQYAFVYNGSVNSTSNMIYPCVMTYDPENKIITDAQDLLINPNQEFYYTLENYVEPVLRNKTIELTTKVPKALKINNFFILDQETGRSSISLVVSSENVDGQPFNSTNLYYQILLPGFKSFDVYTFEPNLYDEITEPITDLPFSMTSGLVSGYGSQRNTYIYIPDYDNVGARMVYKDETGIYYSEPTFYYPLDLDAVENISMDEAPVKSEWYTLQGLRVDEPLMPGIYIRRDIYANGLSRSIKVNISK